MATPPVQARCLECWPSLALPSPNFARRSSCCGALALPSPGPPHALCRCERQAVWCTPSTPLPRSTATDVAEPLQSGPAGPPASPPSRYSFKTVHPTRRSGLQLSATRRLACGLPAPLQLPSTAQQYCWHVDSSTSATLAPTLLSSQPGSAVHSLACVREAEQVGWATLATAPPALLASRVDPSRTSPHVKFEILSVPLSPPNLLPICSLYLPGLPLCTFPAEGLAGAGQVKEPLCI